MRAGIVTIAALGMFAAMPAIAQEPAAQDMAQPAAAEESWLPTLITDTPVAGFDLAITMARKAVTTTQTETGVLHALRPNYAHDPQSLIDVSGVAAAWFATIAEANEYWRD